MNLYWIFCFLSLFYFHSQHGHNHGEQDLDIEKSQTFCLLLKNVMKVPPKTKMSGLSPELIGLTTEVEIKAYAAYSSFQ